MAIEFYNRNWRVPSSWNGTEDNNNKVSNYSMSFASSRVNLGTSLDLGINSTISLWLNTSTFGGVMLLSETSYQYGYFTYMDGSNIILVIGSSSPKYYSHSMVVGQWYHLIIVRQGTSVEIFINNTSLGTQTGFGTTVSTKFDTFGGKTSGGYAYAGKLDGLSAFNYALSSSQITTLYGSSSTGVGNPMAITNGRKPVAYYPLGDYSAYNGTEYLVANSALSDYVFDFSSTSQVINFATIDLGTTHTISMWVKVISTNASFFRIFTGTGGSAILLNIPNRIYYYSNNYTVISPSVATTLNEWNNIVITRESSTLKFYVNNSLLLTTSFTGDDFSFNKIQGLDKPNQLSNVAIFNTALPATGTESVASLYNYGTPPDISSYSGLQGFWKLDAGSTFDGSNWTVPDESSNSNDGTSSGMTAANLVQSNLNILSPYSRYALDFDAVNERIDTSSISALDNATSFTLSTWVYWDTTGNSNEWLFMAANSNRSIRVALELYNQDLFFSFTGATGRVAVDMINSSWVNVVAVFDNTASSSDKMIIYLNGSKPTQLYYIEPTGNSPTGMTVASIGGRTDGYGFDGKISNFSIWNSALSSTQVTEIYNESKPSNLKNHSSYSNLISWWTLGENSSFNSNWTVLNEISTGPNGVSVNMAEDDLVNGVGTTANGLSSGMGGADNINGDAPYSTSNALSYGMGADAKSTSVPT